MRDILDCPNGRFFTQGSIFDGFKFDDIGGSINAIVITARCDISNYKARNILCLPVYRANDWILNQGQEIIFRRVAKKVESKIESFLKRAGISFDSLRIYPIDNVLDLVRSEGKLTPIEFDEFSRLSVMYKKKVCDFSLPFVQKERDSFSSSVISNSEASIYFLEQVSTSDVLDPHVVDLAAPVSIPLSLADKLISGVNKFNSTEEDCRYVLNDDSAFISVLKSPYIEHLLQKFSSFYGRIGTDDLGQESVDFLKELLRKKMDEK